MGAGDWSGDEGLHREGVAVMRCSAGCVLDQ